MPKYDVYISHAGPDKETLAVLIYEGLRRRGISAFLDLLELRAGDTGMRQMEEAMETALVGLFILSPEFALRRYPMLEVKIFLRRAGLLGNGDEENWTARPVLIPVFYRLTVAQCKYVQEFERMNCDEAERNGFDESVQRGETSWEDVLEHLRLLSSRTGVENRAGIGNDDTHEMKTRRKELAEKICDEITRVLTRRVDSEEVDPKILERALRGGKKKLHTVRLMVLGAPSRGKTSTVASLKGNHRLSAGQKQQLDQRDKFAPSYRAFEQAQSRLARGSRGEDLPTPNVSSQEYSASSESVQSGIADSMEYARSSLPSDILRLELRDSLIGRYGESLPDCITLRCWDFGGQPEYEVAHELFISPRSIIMLVFDLPLFENEATREEEVRKLHHWMQTVFAVTPEVDLESTCESVVIVGTKKGLCEKPHEVPSYFKRLRNMLTCNLDYAITSRWKMRNIRMIAIENRDAVEDPEGSGLAELENHLHGTARSIIDRSEDVPLRWLAVLDRLRLRLQSNGQQVLSMNQQTTEEISEEIHFSQERERGLNIEVYNCLKFFRNLGEIVLFDTSGLHIDNEVSPYLVFVNPELILGALKVIVAPEEVRVDGLSHQKDMERICNGEITASALEDKWGELPGLASKGERDKLVALMTSMDVFIALKSNGVLGVPSLLKETWDDLKWLKPVRTVEREVSAMTRFEGCIPFGFIGTLIGRLHRTIGDERTDVQLIRASAVLLTPGKRRSENEHWQIFVGFDRDNRELHWKVRGPRWNFGLLWKCLSEFEDHKMRHLVRRSVASTHFFLADCPQKCSVPKFRLQFEIPLVQIQLELCALRESGSTSAASAWCGNDEIDLTRVSGQCDIARCENLDCGKSSTLLEAVRQSAPSEAPGALMLPSNCDYTVFISHAGPDKDTVAIPLYEALRAHLVPSFVDKREMRPGDEAIPAMTKAMNTAPILVAIVSPEFCARVWTMREVNCFLERDEKAKAHARRSGSFLAWLLRSFGGGDPTKLCEPCPGKGGRPIIIPVFYRLTCAQCRYLDFQADVTDEDPHNMRRYKEMLNRFDPELMEIKKSMKSLSGWTGIVNGETKDETRATNENSAEMAELRAQLIGKVVKAVLEAVQKLERN